MNKIIFSNVEIHPFDIWFLEDTKVGGKIANWFLRKIDNSGWHYYD